ncbi:MAG: hypothetical protein HQ559_10695, partial [Lentisphaerae bacterium]|nr:hypothetical protein [Lentisphaerota bacterium]
MKRICTLTAMLVLGLCSAAAAAPTNQPSFTVSPLAISNATGAIVGPTSAAVFRAANAIPSTNDTASISGRVDVVEGDLVTVSGRVDVVEADVVTVSGRV